MMNRILATAVPIWALLIPGDRGTRGPLRAGVAGRSARPPGSGTGPLVPRQALRLWMRECS